MLGLGSAGLVVGFLAVVTASLLWKVEGKRAVSNLFGFSGLSLFAGGMLLILSVLTGPADGGVVTREVPIDVPVQEQVDTPRDNTLTV